MLILTQHLSTVQNLGLKDRVIRGGIAALMIGLPPLDLVNGGLFGWHGYVMLLGIYPAITSILGWDPLYSLFKVRSCGNTQRNQCGTFPFEMDAALGHNPIVDKDHEFDHSLSPDYQQGALRGNVMTLKTQNRLLTLASVILTIAVIAYLSFLIK